MLLIRTILLLVFLLGSARLSAQVNRYMVFFTNKTGTPYSVSEPGDFLSERSILRRQKQGIAVSEEDLPVVASYVESVSAAGAAIIYRTKWMNGVLVECPSTVANTLESLPFVSKVELVAPGARPPSSGRLRATRNKKGTMGTDEVTDLQLSMIGIDYMHSIGYKGEGMLIAVCDAGFLGADVTVPFQHIFQDNRFDATTSYDFVHGGHEVFKYDDHGTRAFSIIGAFQNGSFAGGAYKANFVLFVTEDDGSEYRIEEYNWLFAAERADSAGVDIISTSLGYNTFDDPQMDYQKSQMDGATAIITQAAERAAAKGIAIIVSAGNEGNNQWGIITAPADGANVYAVGAVTSAGERSISSSMGPSADGRIKPDVAAIGTGVSVVRFNGSISTSSGTSFSAPLISSLVAGVWQMLPDLTVKQVLDTIRNTASQAKAPDNLLGYGIPNFASILQITSVESGKLPGKLVDVFPNPFSNDFLVRPVAPELTEQMQVEVMDMSGRRAKVYDVQTGANELSIHLSGNPAGIYILRVRVNHRVETHKLLKLE